MLKKKSLVWYVPELIEQARELRNNPTEAESVLWERLKGKQVRGYDFHRQKPLLKFIVDFYCTPLRLAIELDGEVHQNEDIQSHDESRQEMLEDHGITVLRFSNYEVFSDCKTVIDTIAKWIDEHMKEE